MESNLKGYNELVYKTETDSQISKSNLWIPKGETLGGSDKLGDWD